MAFNGSGVFVRLYNWVNDKANGIKIRADRMDAEMNGFAAGLSTCITKDGQTTPTANLPMGGKRHTGCADAVAASDYATLGQVTTAIATTQSDAAITGGSIAGITDLAVADGGTGASTAASARTNLGLGTMATQSAGSVAITGGSVEGTAITDCDITDCDNAVFGAAASISGGEGTNPDYQVTINGGNAIALERAGGAGGCMIESKVGGGSTTPASEFDSGLQLASSGNDAGGVLREYARARGFVLGTPTSGAGGVGGGFDIMAADGAGNFGIHTRFKGTDGTTETRFKGSTSRTEIAFIRAWVTFNSSGTILSSMNVSSITKHGTGDFTVNFSITMPNANYCPIVNLRGDTLDRQAQVNPSHAPTTTSIRVVTTGSTSVPLVDVTSIYVAIIG
jgi:hypothetical protein